MKVGFIGLGTMGSSMALNVLKGGHELVVHDINRDAVGLHLESGAAWADTPQQVMEISEVVFTSLPGPPEVQAVALGENGLLHGLRPGKVYFDLSTNSPTLLRHIHDEFAKVGAHVLDAPVSGGPRGARSGRLAIWVGGDRAIYEQYKPVLDAIGDKPYYVGPIGAGSIAKLVHNCTGYMLQTALAETFSMGIKAGVDPLVLAGRAAWGTRPTADLRQSDGAFLARPFRPADFALRLARKDVSLAVEVGREFDVPMRLANLTLAELTEALNRGWGQRDSRVAMLLQEERAGIDVHVPPEKIQEILDSDRTDA